MRWRVPAEKCLHWAEDRVATEAQDRDAAERTCGRGALRLLSSYYFGILLVVCIFPLFCQIIVNRCPNQVTQLMLEIANWSFKQILPTRSAFRHRTSINCRPAWASKLRALESRVLRRSDFIREFVIWSCKCADLWFVESLVCGPLVCTYVLHVCRW